ncbi:NAD(P)-dependent alcohol dehydrogenase [Planococcus shenhongbingii]|uniref:NAD(P)-dependent alcohol dehydrogenase n=1 Tax=Planococcus shenhongbingii TaxID=3058398 RepID=UPI00260E5E8D|nr:NAD(P)-dependent alcohol dehydrogenase [Planococcus sp. N016]WKA56973.1 NAD(P)-dependent alcohol dehydrogenase [Planococcus sp. N016]
MKALVATKYGLPEVLRFKEVEKPLPKDNEVLIKVCAASVNSWDWDLLRGKPLVNRIGGLFTPKYQILGADIAGQVAAAGRNVKQFSPGDEVFGDISGAGWGGFAEYVCVREDVLAMKSAHMTNEQAAAIPQAAVLALQGLRYKGRISKGQKVLLNGAGGGVGTFALQIAKLFGAEVTAVDNSGKLDMLRSIGADHVIDYTKENFTENGEQYDLILDVVANRSIFDCKRSLKPKGRYVVIGGTTARIIQFASLGPLVSRMTKKKMGILIHLPNQQDLNVIKELFERGKIVPVIDKSYPLFKAADALQYFGEGQAKGKVVITMD